MNKIVMLLASIALILATTMAPANAVVKRDPDPTFAGSINVVAGKGNGNAIYVTRDRCCGGMSLGPYAWIQPGQSSKQYWPDTDMFYIWPGTDVVYGWKASWGWVASGRYTATGWHTLDRALYVWVVNE